MDQMKKNLYLGSLLEEDATMNTNSYGASFEMNQEGFIIVTQDIMIDKTGVSDARTGERTFMITSNDFVYVQELGRGNGGSVIKVVQKSTGNHYAIKRINIFDKEKRHQLYNDLRALADQTEDQSPYLIRFYGAFYDEGSVSLALEYMDCGTIGDMIKIMLGFQQKNSILIPEGVISSILAKGLAKVTDFGISRLLEDNLCDTFVGTLAYMSPERIDGKDYGFSSDIWSLGIVAYEMSTGRHPYPTTSPLELHEMIKTLPPPNCTNESYISKEMNDFVIKCLQKDPTLRPTAKDLLNHQFIKQYEQSDADLKLWMKEYQEIFNKISEQNLNMHINPADFGLEDFIGMK